MRALRIAALAAISVILASTTHAQETVAITGGTIYPVSGPKITNATIVLSDGVITAIGATVEIGRAHV